MQVFERKKFIFLYFLRSESLLFAQSCDWIFGGLGVPVKRGNRNTGRG